VEQRGPFPQEGRDSVAEQIEEACRKVNFVGWSGEGDVLLVGGVVGLYCLRMGI
jgi:hypothetical protein